MRSTRQLIRRRYDAKVALRVRRVLDGDAPIAAVGLSPHDEHITDDGRVLYTDGLADAFTPNDESGYTYEALA